MEGKLVFPEGTKGIAEASITRRPLAPNTLEKRGMLKRYWVIIIISIDKLEVT